MITSIWVLRILIKVKSQNNNVATCSIPQPCLPYSLRSFKIQIRFSKMHCSDLFPKYPNFCDESRNAFSLENVGVGCFQKFTFGQFRSFFFPPK